MALEECSTGERQLDSGDGNGSVDAVVLAAAVISHTKGRNRTERMASHPDALRVDEIEERGTRRLVELQHSGDHETDVSGLVGIVENRRAAWCVTRREGKSRGGDH